MFPEHLKINCPKCNNRHLRYKVGKYGPFLSCDQYPTCKNVLNFR
ncbi:MAG: topoisomerase DNA-binding C4 zinc finger domain-containing protein [Methanomethylovorans sp.]|nr:topoisomerase DNA-binding C4 zinc finger domain-containing protein [Methanomethylovorans sp.]